MLIKIQEKMRFLIALMMIFIGFVLQAQIGPAPQKNAPKDVKLEEQKVLTPKQKAYNVADAMHNSYKLNDAQHKDLRASLLDYEVRMDKLMKEKGLTLKELAKKKRDLNMERQAHLKRIFTPEQYRRYQHSAPGG